LTLKVFISPLDFATVSLKVTSLICHIAQIRATLPVSLLLVITRPIWQLILSPELVQTTP